VIAFCSLHVLLFSERSSYYDYKRIGCRIVLHVLSDIAVGRWHIKVSSGVRPGSVLSPYLFAVYVDNVGKLFIVYFGKYIALCADDILLLAPSVAVLQRLCDGSELP